MSRRTLAPSRRARLRRAGRRGFTLIELMVALGMTGVVAVGLYSLSAVSAQTFQQQQRVSEMQLRLRTALETLRADIQRAGYMASPGAQRRADPRVCPEPNEQLQAVFASYPANPTHNTAENLFINPVRLVLTGNYVTSDEYRIMGIVGNTLLLQHKSPTYFDRLNDVNAFNRVFPRGRLVRVQGANGQMQFARVQSSSHQPTNAPATAYPRVVLDRVLATLGSAAAVGGAVNGCGIPGLGVGATVAPLSAIEYTIGSAAAELPLAYGGPAEFSLGKTDLLRWVVDPGAGAGTYNRVPNAVRIVAEYAVDFDVAAVFDDAPAIAAEPLLVRTAYGMPTVSRLGSVLVAANNPQRVRSLIVRLSVRERTQDRDFFWVRRGSAAEALTRFRVSLGADPGAARVRSATMEVELPNVAARHLR